jgi:DNA primase
VTFSVQFLDELRGRTSLTALIGKVVQLKKAGRESKGCCPFHSEKTPSFYVNDDKAFYHCFGCSAHGDAIGWMTDHEGLPFIDAVKTLAAAAGLEVPARDTRNEQHDREREEMLSIMGRAAAWYADQLWMDNPGADRAQQYLKDRGIVTRLPQFNVGFSAPGLREHLKDVSDEKLIVLGLLRRRNDGSIGEFFRNRIMFPIRDQRGRTTAFGGRVLGDGQPKYLNSPDTPIFDKGRSLFNIDRAAPIARRANRLMVVEGYMDIIGLSVVDLDEAVAPNGTALTEHQIAALWRIVGTPILCFDGDKAGRAAASRAALKALPMLEPDKSLSFVFPPEGQDPDDVARKGGKSAVEAMLGAGMPLVEMIWRHEREAAPIETPEQKAGLRSRLMALADQITDGSVRAEYHAEFRRRLAPSPAAPWMSRRQMTPKLAAPAGGAKPDAFIVDAIVAGLKRWPNLATTYLEEIAGLRRFATRPGELDAILDAVMAGEHSPPAGTRAASVVEILQTEEQVAAAIDAIVADAPRWGGGTNQTGCGAGR